ncbi:MAG TPA: hypothetical protein PK414_02760 [Anaerolineales bacterium]|nr:hypothetical protein [Anaerolineales bacterium]
MSEYTIKLKAFGLPDDMVQAGSLLPVFEVKRKGEIQNPQTGKPYKENIISLEDKTFYEEGYEKAFNRIFSRISENESIQKYYEAANRIELQIVLWIDDDIGIPSLHFEPEHISFLNSLKAHIDIDIYAASSKT